MSPEVLALLAILCSSPFSCEDATVQNDHTYTFFRLHARKRFEFCWVDKQNVERWRCRNIEHTFRRS